MNKSLLTVIIPVYNTSEYLSRCIESVINQTKRNIEIIIINDASTDNSDVIIQNYIATYPQNMLGRIEMDRSDICISGIKTEVDDIYSWKFRYQYPSDFIVDGDFCMHALTRQYNSDIFISPIVNNKIYNRNLILNNQIKFDKSRRAQDLFFSFMVFIYATQVSICCKNFYHYYQRDFSATHNVTKQYIDDYFYILLTLKNELKARSLYSQYQMEYERYVYHYMTKLINNMFNNIQKENEQRNYFMYILQKANTVISIEKIMEYIDITRLRDFWTMR